MRRLEFLLSIGMVFQVAASFAGGVITDKFGETAHDSKFLTLLPGLYPV